MGNPLLVFPNLVDTATLAGGSWESTLPLTNLQDRRLAKVARSADASLTSTTVTVTLAATRVVRAVGLHGHNLSLAGRVRIRGTQDESSWTRSTVGTYHNKEGLVEQAAVNEARIGHWINGSGRHLLNSAQPTSYSSQKTFRPRGSTHGPPTPPIKQRHRTEPRRQTS